MGTATGSCALSGMEIPEGSEAIGILMSVDCLPGTGYSMRSTPFKAVYPGYSGSADLTEPMILGGHKLGDTISPDQGTAIVWIHPDVFGTLRDLPASDWDDETLGEVVDEHLAEVRNALAEAEAGRAGLCQKAMAVAKIMDITGKLRAVIDRRVFVADGPDLVLLAIRKDPADYERALDEYGRATLLARAQLTLRKQIAPVIIPPQEGGNRAVLAFSEKVTEIARREIEASEEPDEPEM